MYLIERLFGISSILKGVRMSIIVKLLKMILSQASPEIKEAIVSALKEWKVKAAQTSNPWDDLIVELLMYLVGADQ